MTTTSTGSSPWLDTSSFDAGPAAAALDALGASLNTLGPRLHLLGKQRIRHRLEQALSWRILLTQAMDMHPEIARQPLARAVVIVAPFRTGTTLLQRLLAQDERFRCVRPWEVLYAPRALPVRGQGIEADERRDRLRHDLHNLYRRQPELADLHPMGVDMPDECFGFLESSLMSPSFLFYAPVSQYITWLEGASEDEWDRVYARYADHLRLLAWLHSADRWLLKNPIHLWNIAALRRAFPAALLVHLHRDPAASVHSFCRLIAAHHGISMHSVDPVETGRLVRRFYEFALPRAVAARRAWPAGLDVDIAFEDLARDPLNAVQSIYTAAGLDLQPQTTVQMRRWLAKSQKPQPCAVDTNLASFGLRDAEVREWFAAYGMSM